VDLPAPHARPLPLSAFDSTTNQVVNVFGSLTFRSIGDALPTGLDLILANHNVEPLQPDRLDREEVDGQ
jgi:hypothetical protein